MALFSTTPQTKSTIQSLWKLEKIILDTLDFHEVVQKIVDSVLTELDYLKLGYRIIVLALIDEEKQILKRISLSQTLEAEKALSASAIPFHEIEIPLDTEDNLLIKVLKDKRPYTTHYWPELFTPVLTKEQALKNQTAAGIKTSMVYPVIAKDKPLGILIFSMIKDENEVFEDELDLIKGFTDVVGLAVQNAKLYTNLEDTKRQLEKANKRLEEVDELKDEFVSLASHELRTPMTVIKSYTWMLVNGKMGELNQNQKIYLDRIFSSTEGLIKLVNDMLNISRIESGRITIEPVSIDLVKLVEDVLTEIKTRADEVGIHLFYNKSQSSIIVKADVLRIKEVMMNLLGNSLKFTPEGGTVTVTVAPEDNDFAAVKIKDTGRGISSFDMLKLFKKFNMVGNSHLTKEKGQGTGLGLYLSKSLVELHGGKIWVESEGKDKGSTFSFTLPIDHNFLKDSIEAASAAVNSNQNSKTNTDLPLVPYPRE